MTIQITFKGRKTLRVTTRLSKNIPERMEYT